MTSKTALSRSCSAVLIIEMDNSGFASMGYDPSNFLVEDEFFDFNSTFEPMGPADLPPCPQYGLSACDADGTQQSPQQQQLPNHQQPLQQPQILACETPAPNPRRSVATVALLTLPTGPMSSPVNLKPRPKPGRKPMVDEDKTNARRQQNRIAQRRFRDRRHQKLVETQADLHQAKETLKQKDIETQNLRQRLVVMTGPVGRPLTLDTSAAGETRRWSGDSNNQDSALGAEFDFAKFA
ncbi:hypothetical protein LTR62_000537 [Meristemomyces frigidus]|uniref:BZIP domain-containing protein n=1 Tax=Meristemomyces frigidus TaxID=1508187 RepID=A0AAN7YMW6_9PEZI|nr:hypothetical protein LTR62_000537 [Meristemomyces frigidus]